MRVKTHVAVFTLFFQVIQAKEKAFYFRFVLLPVQSLPIPREPEAATRGIGSFCATRNPARVDFSPIC